MANIINYRRTGDQELLTQCQTITANLALTGMTEFSERLHKFYKK